MVPVASCCTFCVHQNLLKSRILLFESIQKIRCFLLGWFGDRCGKALGLPMTHREEVREARAGGETPCYFVRMGDSYISLGLSAKDWFRVLVRLSQSTYLSSYVSGLSLFGEAGYHLPKISETTGRMYDHEIFTRRQAQLGGTKSEFFFDITWLVCKLQTKLFFRNAFSRHANFTKFCRIVTIDVRNKSWKFEIDISKIHDFVSRTEITIL